MTKSVAVVVNIVSFTETLVHDRDCELSASLLIVFVE